MVKDNQSRKRYPSDRTDEPWPLVAPRLPPAQPRQRGGRPRQVARREGLNTRRSLHRRGGPWDRCPPLDSQRAPPMTPLPHGVTTALGAKWARRDAHRRVWLRGVRPRQARSASLGNRSRLPRSVVLHAGRTVASACRAGRALAWWTPWGSSWRL